MNYDDDENVMPPAPGETMGVWADELVNETATWGTLDAERAAALAAVAADPSFHNRARLAILDNMRAMIAAPSDDEDDELDELDELDEADE